MKNRICYALKYRLKPPEISRPELFMLLPHQSALQSNYLRVVSLNLNGLRSAHSKGVLDWMQASDADVFCLQETRLQSHQWLDAHKPPLWYTHLFPAQRPGYAGTALYSRLPLVDIRDGLGFASCDEEGRFCQATVVHPSGARVDVASAYFPSGSSGEAAQAKKDGFLLELLPRLQRWREQGRSLILCGDVNIAHKAIDLKNWRSNQMNSGFLPHERAWMDALIDQVGWVDAFRVLNRQAEQYSWWSNRGQAWAKNVGWRIDYHLVTPDWREAVSAVSVYKDQRFSDHAPVVIDYDLNRRAP
jgi:exodeoxyribonuclease-3